MIGRFGGRMYTLGRTGGHSDRLLGAVTSFDNGWENYLLEFGDLREQDEVFQ